ncbi:MAG: hypothetical protein AABX14_01700 [Candidatus Aenigmatarchaeota archaeon]
MVSESNKNVAITLMIVVLIALIGINQYLISSSSSSVTAAVVKAQSSAQQSSSSDYGVPLDNNGYQMLLGYRNSISLSADQNAEYNKLIGYGPNGKPYIDHPCCGAAISQCAPCGHGAAIQGLIKLLLKNGYAEQQILGEALKWNKMFFPEYYQNGGQQSSGVGGC